MKSLIKKITIGLVLFGLSIAAFAQDNSVENRYYKGVIDGTTAEIIFLEDNTCLLIASDNDYVEYMACKYLYVPAKNIGFLWEDEESYLDFEYGDYILLNFDDAKGSMTMKMDDESYTLKLVK